MKIKMMTTIMSNGDNDGDDDGDACHDSDDDDDVYVLVMANVMMTVQPAMRRR